MQHLTWLNIFQHIRQTLSTSARQVESTFRRYLAPRYGYSISSVRATNLDKLNFEEWCCNHPVPLKTREQWTSEFQSDLADSQLSKKQQRSSLCYSLKIIKALEELGHLVVVSLPEDTVSPTKRKVPRKRITADWEIESPDKNSPVKRQKNYKLTLSFDATSYLHPYRALYPELTDEAILQIIQPELDRIQQELDDFQSYLSRRAKNKHRSPTQSLSLDKIKRLLGWSFQQKQNLASVGLQFLIPAVNTKISSQDYPTRQDYLLAKAELEEKLEFVAEDVLDFLINFFDGYGPHYSRETKVLHINALINVVKYRYQNITRKARYSNFQDIAIFAALTAFRVGLSKDSPQVKKIPLSLDKFHSYLEKFKQQVDYAYNEHLYPTGKIYRKKRDDTAIAHDIQRFLIIALLGVIPPLRRRSIAQLELGRTLIEGIEDGNNFIHKQDMKDPSQALYYYDMLPGDYKTGDTYGLYCVPLPNPHFKDGTCLYDYLNKFIYEGHRDTLLRKEQTHKFLFVQILNRPDKNSFAGDPIKLNAFSQVTGDLTEKITGKRISPQVFRRIYRTFYVNAGAPPDVLDSLAFFMQHSPETAMKDYTYQTIVEKMTPFKNYQKKFDFYT